MGRWFGRGGKTLVCLFLLLRLKEINSGETLSAVVPSMCWGCALIPLKVPTARGGQMQCRPQEKVGDEHRVVGCHGCSQSPVGLAPALPHPAPGCDPRGPLCLVRQGVLVVCNSPVCCAGTHRSPGLPVPGWDCSPGGLQGVTAGLQLHPPHWLGCAGLCPVLFLKLAVPLDECGRLCLDGCWEVGMGVGC